MDNLEKAKQKFFKDLRARIERMVTKGAFASEECWEWKGATRALITSMAGSKSHFLDFRKLLGLTGHHIWPSTKSLIFMRTSPIPVTWGLCVNSEHLFHDDHVVNMARAHCKANASKCLDHNFRTSLQTLFTCHR